LIIFRVEAQARPDQIAVAGHLLTALATASRGLPGVVAFDILPDPDQAGRFVSIEVYQDQSALDQQSTLPELRAVMDDVDILFARHPHGTIFHTTRSEPWPAL
jgi:quinol monooxygenase YgiN